MAPEHEEQESLLVRLARDYGWRAYAVPVLVVITVWVLVDVLTGPAPDGASGGAGASGDRSTQAGPMPGQQSAPHRADGSLPDGGSFTKHGQGATRIVGSAGEKFGEGKPRDGMGGTFTYTVEVEKGLKTQNYGGDDAFAALVDATLKDPRSWTADSRFAFQHVAADQEPDLHIMLASTDTVHLGCGNSLGLETSCFTSEGNRVLLNEARWVRGSEAFQGDLGAYRQYMINHEVGHGIGYAKHVPCEKDGDLAPVMMQQTLGMTNGEIKKINPNEVYPDNAITCRPNSWPHPFGKSK